MAAFTGNSIVGQVIAGDGHVVSGGQHGFVNAVASAQLFGAANVVLGGMPTPSVPSAALFGPVTIKAVFPLRPAGVASAQQFGPVTALLAASSVTVSGVGSAQLFGWVTPLNRQFAGTVAGVGSAARFGVPHIAFWQPLPVAGVASAQLFGKTFVANLLPVSVCTPLAAVTAGCVSLTAATVGCGPVTVTTPADTTLVSSPAGCVPLILGVADV